VKKIAVLSYKFPPYNKVGARRWAKLSKYLSRMGYNVHVITANWPESGGSWDADVTAGENLIVNRWGTPVDALMRASGPVFGRLKFYVARMFLWSDEAYHYYYFNYRKIVAYLKQHEITLVIATGAPFSTNYFAAQLRKRHPEMKLIQDFRDMWTEEFYLEYPTIRKGSRLQKKIFAMEAVSLQHCDAVVSVTPGCTGRFRETAGKSGAADKPFVTVENGYDPEDARIFSEGDFPSDAFLRDGLNIAHFGTMDAGRDVEFYRFLKSLTDQIAGSSIRFRFVLFGHFNTDTRLLLEQLGLGDAVVFRQPLPPAETYRYMYFADVHLAVNDPVFFYAYGSKLFEAYMYRRAVLVISDKREGLNEFVWAAGTGYTTDNTGHANLEVFDAIVSDYGRLKAHGPFNPSYDYSRHSLPVLAKAYAGLIEQTINHSHQQ
jgi:hypothetical protein